MVVNPGGTNQSFVDEHIKQAQIIRVQNNVDNLEALRQKTADMMVTDLIEGDYYQSKEPGVFCVANETPFAGTASDKVYMMNKDNPALLEKVNQWLGILRQLRQGLRQMAQRRQQRPYGGQQGKPHPAAVGEQIKQAIQFTDQHGEEEAADEDIAIAQVGIFSRQQEVNQYDDGQHALLHHFGERHLRDVVAKHPNIHP